MQTHYQILGLNEDCTLSEIKKSYKSLVKKHHPDTSSNLEESNDFIIKLNEAYSVLSDKESKKKYDALLAAERSFNSEYSNVSPLYEGKFTKNNTSYIDPHIKINLSISLEDLYSPHKKYKIHFTQKKICDCAFYNLTDFECTSCNSLGYITSDKTVLIEIPKNSFINSNIIYKGIGNTYKSNNSYQTGHLIVNIINIELPHEFYLIGNDVMFRETIKIDSLDALVGHHVNLLLPTGNTIKYEYKSTELFNSSNLIKIPNEGIPLDSGKRSDVYYTLEFTRPNKNTMARIRYMIRNNAFSNLSEEQLAGEE